MWLFRMAPRLLQHPVRLLHLTALILISFVLLIDNALSTSADHKTNTSHVMSKSAATLAEFLRVHRRPLDLVDDGQQSSDVDLQTRRQRRRGLGRSGRHIGKWSLP